VRTTRDPGGRSRHLGAVAVTAALLGFAVPAAAVTPTALASRAADGGCVAGDAAGQVRCENVLNNSLNNISVHILGH
jgi:hypothetical protein